MTDTSSALRSFIAVPLPPAVQAEIAGASRELARELPGVKWSKKPENLHVTMRFLGPVTPERLDALGAALVGALAVVPRFGFIVRGWGAFPSARDARVLFAEVEGEGARALVAMAEIVEATAVRFGFAREQRRFTAHVTVGRCERRGGIDARAALAPWADRVFGAVTVEEIHVYESQLGGEGSTYVLRSRASLGASNELRKGDHDGAR
jgi:2'-5' RNA ligase